MTIETPLVAAFFATAGAVLIAVIGLMSSVHYRLGKLEQGQQTLAQEDAHTREMTAQENAHTRELLMQEIAASRERSDAQHAETLAAIQRLTDAFLSHSHDIDGTIQFRVPPPVAPPEQQEP